MPKKKPFMRHEHSTRQMAVPFPVSDGNRGDFASLIDKLLAWGLGLLCLFISISFYTGTYDTAYVKITLLQTCGVGLIALWLGLLAVQKRSPINRQNLPWILPFVVYFGWNIIGYLWAPYKMEAFDEFLRYVLYGGLGLMILDRFRTKHIHILTKCIIAAAWISCIYGLVQLVDRWVPGVDLMPWRGFFGTRIFSTHANPNFFADFVVFSSCIVTAEYLRAKSKRLLILLALALVDLFFSESKGAWIGFAASGAFFVGLFLRATASGKKYMRAVSVAAAVALIGIAILAGVYAAKRFQSVSFRAYTWASVLDMIQDSPVVGTGVGSFKIIYPAYRKPQIFYIENMHNNETQHAENEYLEQWATAGTVGLAIFLWLIFYVLYISWRGAKRDEENKADAKWLSVGYSAAFFGICVHNTFDVSMHFVSTGLFFVVFAALVMRLQMLPAEEEKTVQLPAARPWILQGLRLLLATGCVALASYYIHAFAEVSGAIGGRSVGGVLLKIISWGVLIGLLIWWIIAYMRAAFAAKWARTILILLISLCPLYYAYGFFLADHYYGVAASFSEKALLDGALDYYQKAIAHNPFVVSYRQYRAYILRLTKDSTRSFSPVKGDEKLQAGQQPLNDYERALRDLKLVQKRAPNNALLHQSLGEFYYTYAVQYTQLSMTDVPAYQRQEYEKKAVENMELAKKSFQYSLLLDPVNEATYVYLTKIAMMERNPAQAQAWIDAYRRGPEGVVEKDFLQTHEDSALLTQMEMQLHQPPYSGWWNSAK